LHGDGPLDGEAATRVAMFKLATTTIPAFPKPQSGLRPSGVAPGSVGVVVPVLTGPFTPPLAGVLIDEFVVAPDPFVSALPVIPGAPSGLPAGVWRFGLGRSSGKRSGSAPESGSPGCRIAAGQKPCC
jgi:hypothetical protein